MKIPFLAIVIIFLILMSGSTFLIYKLLFKEKEELSEEEKVKKTAQDFINVKDIKDCFLFTNDDKTFVYLDVTPISVEMMSDNEKRLFIKNVTSALSGIRTEFKTISFPKATDLSFLIYKYEAMYDVAGTDIEKKLIRQEIEKMKKIMMNNDANEFKFYFCLWDSSENTSELLKKANDFKNSFTSSVKMEIISEKEIYRLCNMMNNPNYTNFDNNEF